VIDTCLYLLARIVVAFLRVMPLGFVAQFGRGCGHIIFWLDGRHRKVALQNLTLCFNATKSPREIRHLAHENFRRIGENYCCAIKTAVMSDSELKGILEIKGLETLRQMQRGQPDGSCVFATGHFGNFELFTRFPAFIQGYQCAATYRGLDYPALDQFLRKLRSASGALLFERRRESDALKKAMRQGKMLLVLVSDQSARNGIELPFFGRNCSVTCAPAIMAMRYHCSLFVPVCYRTAAGRWCIEIGPPVPTRENGILRSADAITRDVNHLMESAIRRDPANWFWVHNRWKIRPVKRAAVAEASLSPAETVENF
jgi:lauroyl/myristoyl acyltransferase